MRHHEFCQVVKARNSYKSNRTGRTKTLQKSEASQAMAKLYEPYLLSWVAVNSRRPSRRRK